MLARISYRQFREWQQVANLIGPIGIQRADWQFAKVLAMIVNRTLVKGERALKPEDFMPDWECITHEERMRRSMIKVKAWAYQRSPEVRKMREQGKRKKGAKP